MTPTGEYQKPTHGSNGSAPTLDAHGHEVQITEGSNNISKPDWKDDSSNPHNWPAVRKYVNTILLSAFVFNTLMSSTMVAPALSRISHDLGIINDAETQLILSIFVLSYAVGHFLWAPLSEIYGRKSILQISNLWFLVWNVVCGFATNEVTISLGRLFSGAGAAACLALGVGTMGEIWLPVQRGRSLAVLSLITNLGPAVGPIVGGVIAQRSVSSWRWIFWSTSAFNGLLQLVSLRFLHESHHATISRKKCPEASHDKSDKEHKTIQALITAFKRPFCLLLTFPASQGLAVYNCFTFGTLYILLGVIPIAFTTVHKQSIMIASLNYISFAIGTTFGAQVCAAVIDSLYQHRLKMLIAQAESGHHANESLPKAVPRSVPPEIRLYPFVPTVLLMSGGLLVFSWTLQTHTHWIGTNFGVFMFGAGHQAMTQCTNAYNIDVFGEIRLPTESREPQSETTFKETRLSGDGQQASGLVVAANTSNHSVVNAISTVNWSASAMASIWAAKSLGGFGFPLFAIDMIHHLGWGWSGTLLALFNVALGVPLAIVLLIHGKKLRETGEKRVGRMMRTGKL